MSTSITCSNVGRRRGYVEVLAQTDVRHNIAANVDQVFAIGVIDLLTRKLDAFECIGERQNKVRVAHRHQQPVNDRQCQREAQRDGRPYVRLADHVDAATELVDVAAHHVQCPRRDRRYP